MLGVCYRIQVLDTTNGSDDVPRALLINRKILVEQAREGFNDPGAFMQFMQS